MHFQVNSRRDRLLSQQKNSTQRHQAGQYFTHCGWRGQALWFRGQQASQSWWTHDWAVWHSSLHCARDSARSGLWRVCNRHLVSWRCALCHALWRSTFQGQQYGGAVKNDYQSLVHFSRGHLQGRARYLEVSAWERPSPKNKNLRNTIAPLDEGRKGPGWVVY